MASSSSIDNKSPTDVIKVANSAATPGGSIGDPPTGGSNVSKIAATEKKVDVIVKGL